VKKKRTYLRQFVPINNICKMDPKTKNGEEIACFINKVSELQYEINKLVVKTNNKIINNVCSYIIEHVNDKFSLQQMANEFYIDKKYLSYLMKKETGIYFTEYVNLVKIERAKRLLDNPSFRIAEIAYELGYSDVDYFAKVFKKLTAQTPKKYRETINI